MNAHLKVEFNDLEEFLTELSARQGNLAEPIVRVTFQHQESPQYGPALSHISLLATFVVALGDRLQIIELRRFLGQKMLHADTNKLDKLCEELLKKVEGAVKDLNLETRAGTYTFAN